MKNAAYKFLTTFFAFAIIFAIVKPIFMFSHGIGTDSNTISNIAAVIAHGISMDLATAGYLTILPGILITAMLISRSNIINTILRIYLAIASLLISAIVWLDTILYGYWGSKLDSTPIFYFVTSPSAAMASVEWWQIILIGIGTLATAVAIFAGLDQIVGKTSIQRGSWKSIGGMLLLTAALFLPIRGSLTVSTMNPSHAYFCNVRELNHAAVNPAFNLLYSISHTQSYGDHYQFMPDDEATAQLNALNATHHNDSIDSDSTIALVNIQRPDIVLIILESFSTHLMPCYGGDSIAVGLDSIANSGLQFKNIYASGIRTDRALTAILSAIPAQPAHSILKYVDKIEHLPSLPNALKQEGYALSYFYGGDANFTNMQAYLMSMGFDYTVTDKDFAVTDKASKWGAPDHLLFNRAKQHLSQNCPIPRLTVIQTSSSHEPFDVPYHNARFDKGTPQNAFAYTDSCVTDFVNTLRNNDTWRNTLVVLVPDHYGCWPKDLKTTPERHTIPLVMTGGALNTKGINTTIGSQTDITATILSALNIPCTAFPFSHNLLSSTHPQYAFMSEPGIAAIVTKDGYTSFNCDANTIEDSSVNEKNIDQSTNYIKCYLQKLYHYLSEL